MKKFPEVVYFLITSRCNHDCKYCYGPKGIEDLGLGEIKKIVDLFSRGGVKAVVLTGGEPLIREDIGGILKLLKRRKMRIFLDTNGDFFFKNNKAIDKWVDILGLPIDSDSGGKSYRSADNFKNVLKILEYYKGSLKRPQIRVGTVVTKENVGFLEKIASMLVEYGPDMWKIYQFIPIGKNALDNTLDLEIETELFDKEVNKVREKYSKYFKIIVSKRRERTEAYFMIYPDGGLIMPTDNGTRWEHVSFGNIFDKNIIDKWEKLVAEERYKKNTESTFNYKFGFSSGK